MIIYRRTIFQEKEEGGLSNEFATIYVLDGLCQRDNIGPNNVSRSTEQMQIMQMHT